MMKNNETEQGRAGEATTSISAWKARVRGLNHTEQSLNTETHQSGIPKGRAPMGVSYSVLNQR